MKFSMLLIVAAATGALAIRKCGTEEPSTELIAANAALMKESTLSIQDIHTEAISVPVWFHVLRSGTSVSQGNIADSALYEQVYHPPSNLESFY
jgi:hypothetical protein